MRTQPFTMKYMLSPASPSAKTVWPSPYSFSSKAAARRASASPSIAWSTAMCLSSSGFIGPPLLRRSSYLVLLALGDQRPELKRMIRLAHGILLSDQPRLVEFGQRLFHRAHAVAGSGLDGGVNLVRFALANERGDGRRHHQDLPGGHTPLAVRLGQQHLRHNSFQSRGQHHPDLLLLVRRKYVNDAIHRLGGVLGVERREHQVAG